MFAMPAVGKNLLRRLKWPLLALALSTALMLAQSRPSTQAATGPSDLALVLAIDCSYSVDDREYRLQLDGMASAFRTPEIQAAIAQGEFGKISVSVVVWSSVKFQKVVVPWTDVSGPADAEMLARAIERAPRAVPVGGTSISQALLFSNALFKSGPQQATRRVIDVSSDGRNNSGRAAPLARDVVSGMGTTINALVIPSPEWSVLDKWFERNVIGGPYHFVIVAETYDDYAEAIYRKLLREITGPGVS